jgi:hypothetical protein
MPQLLKITLAIIILTVAAVLLYPSNPEEAVTRVLKRSRIAIESANVQSVMSCISLSYRDDLGFTYGALRGSFGYTFSEFKNIQIDFRLIDIKPGKDTGVAEINVWARGIWTAANRLTDIAGTKDRFERVLVACRKETAGWKVINTRWPERKEGVGIYSSR